MIDILLGVPDLPQEQELVTAAGTRGLRIVRRCVDAVDLLAAAAAAPLAVAVVSAGLPRLSTDAAARIGAGRPGRLIGLAADDVSAERLREVGVRSVCRCGPSAEATASVLAGRLTGAVDDPEPGRDSGVWPTGYWPDATDEPSAGARAGRVIAVWGAMGAPGRTTVAIGVSEALAEDGRRVCLVDADTYAPGVALALGIITESGGLAAACRHADHGSLGPASLVSCARVMSGGWHVLSGLPRAERWPELRASALDAVWEACRPAFDVTVVDIGFCLEDDGAEAWARSRNVAALTAMATADHVLAVADAAPGGAARLITGWPQLQRAAGSTPVTVVRNRSRGHDRGWSDAVRSAGVGAPIRSLPNDPKALEACWARGRSLGEGARRSRLRRALGEVAASSVSG